MTFFQSMQLSPSLHYCVHSNRPLMGLFPIHVWFPPYVLLLSPIVSLVDTPS